MVFQTKRFVLGVDKVPAWFNEQAQKGRVKPNHEDGDLMNVTVYMPTGTAVAKAGDTIILSKTGLAVISGKKADVQQTQRADNKKEE